MCFECRCFYHAAIRKAATKGKYIMLHQRRAYSKSEIRELFAWFRIQCQTTENLTMITFAPEERKPSVTVLAMRHFKEFTYLFQILNSLDIRVDDAPLQHSPCSSLLPAILIHIRTGECEDLLQSRLYHRLHRT